MDEAMTALEDEFYDDLERDLAKTDGPVDKLRHMADLAAGSGPAVGDWILWLELWVRALRDPAARTAREQLDRRWRTCLRAAIDEGVASGDFHSSDLEATTVRLASLMDGLAIQLALEDESMSPERMQELWLASAAFELNAPALHSGAERV
jgi:hypothetical protein